MSGYVYQIPMLVFLSKCDDTTLFLCSSHCDDEAMLITLWQW